MRAVIEIARINPMRSMSERGAEPIQAMESCSWRRWRWRIQIRGVRLGAKSQHQQRQYEYAG
jgi:hypothetical protein